MFASIEDLKKNKPCTRECGIVKVEVVLTETVQDSDYSKMEADNSRCPPRRQTEMRRQQIRPGGGSNKKGDSIK